MRTIKPYTRTNDTHTDTEGKAAREVYRRKTKFPAMHMLHLVVVGYYERNGFNKGGYKGLKPERRHLQEQ